MKHPDNSPDLPDVLRRRPGGAVAGQPERRGVYWMLWSAVAVLAVVGLGYPVETVVVAPGRVIPSDRVKSVQHLEGGIVAAVLVKDGERVREGQPLVEIDLGGNGLNLEELSARFASN